MRAFGPAPYALFGSSSVTMLSMNGSRGGSVILSLIWCALVSTQDAAAQVENARGLSDALKARLDGTNTFSSSLKAMREATAIFPPAGRIEPQAQVRPEGIPPVALSKTLVARSSEQRAALAGSLDNDINELQQQLERRLQDPNKTPNLLTEIDELNAALTAKRQARDFVLGEVTPLSNAAAEAFVAISNPYFLVCRDVIWAPKDPVQWSEVIAPRQADLIKAGRSVGMITRNGGLVGTSFVVGPNQVLTNLHVLKEIATFDAGAKRWTFLPNVLLHFDVEYPLGAGAGCEEANASRTYYLNGVWAVPSQNDDMAILLTSKDADYPPKLKLAVRPPEKYRNNMTLAVVGYPGQPLDMAMLEQMEYFSAPGSSNPQFAVKRLSAGFTGTAPVSTNGVFQHKANTSRGNSGSPIFDLADGSVVGMHMQGTSNRFNHVLSYNEGIVSQRIIQLLVNSGLAP